MISALDLYNRVASAANRAVSSVSAQIRVAVANLWRDAYNPLRGLTMRRAISLLEDETRGAFADLQWTYRAIEGQDATLGALVERRCSAIQQLDWDIKTRDDVPEEKKEIAARQARALRTAYEALDNLDDAIENLVLASFRGYTHLEKIEGPDGMVTRLELVEQWYWVREGLNGEWALNVNATPGVTKGEDVDLSRFVIREVARPINRVAIICHVRKGLSEKDWDAYVEEFGIPAVFVILPKDVPTDQLEDYIATANAITGNARGTLPGGSDVKTITSEKGSSPFAEHIRHQDECLVLRGTGGLLTMLAQSGSGTLAGGAHQEAFDLLARAEAGKISGILRKQFDADVLAKATPGESAWAYFELAATEENDPSKIVTDVVALEGAGLLVETAWIAEKSGYPVIRGEKIPPSKPEGVAGPLRGRAAALDGSGRVIGAERPETPSEAISEAKLNNRESRKDGTTGDGSGNGSDEPAGDWLDRAAEAAFQSALEDGGETSLEDALLASARVGLGEGIEGEDLKSDDLPAPDKKKDRKTK